MKSRLIALVSWLCLTAAAVGDIIHADAPGLTLYVRIYTAATTSVAVALTEGTSSGVGFYRVTDAALVSGGLSSASWSTYPGGYPYKVFSGTPSTTANDPLRGSGSLHWSGSVELASAADAKQIASDSTAASNLDDAFDEGGGSGVDMALQSLTVSNTGGNAVTLLSANAAALTAQVVSGNGNGISFIGSGTGEGAFLQGGSTGNGLEVDGGASGDDLVLTANDWPGLETLFDFVLDDGTTTYDRTTDSLQEIKDALGSGSGGVNVVQWNGTNVATPSVAGVPEVDLTHINGSAASALSGNIDTSNVLLETAVATVTSTSVFTLAAGSTVDDAYNGQPIVIYDDSNSDYPWVGTVDDYTGSTKKVTLHEALGFTPVASDEVRIFVGASAEMVEAMTSVSAFLVDRDHTWRFDNRTQVTAPNNIEENIGFIGLVAMDFTEPMPALSTINTVGTVAIADVGGETEPTITSSSVSPDKKKVHVLLNAASATDSTYTITVTITTTDSQTFVRKGRLVIR